MASEGTPLGSPWRMERPLRLTRMPQSFHSSIVHPFSPLSDFPLRLASTFSFKSRSFVDKASNAPFRGVWKLAMVRLDGDSAGALSAMAYVFCSCVSRRTETYYRRCSSSFVEWSALTVCQYGSATTRHYHLNDVE